MMINQQESYELIKFEDGGFSLDVKVSPDEDTVWLTQKEMAQLFDVDRTRITRHINNIFEELELNHESNVRKAHFPFSDKLVTMYSLDVILAVGYRVNSKRGIQFRKWANSILKQYLLNGYVINKDRVIAYQSNILKLEASFIDIENRLKNLEDTTYVNNSKIIYEGEILEPYTFLIKLFFLAKNKIVIIDSFADEFLLKMLEKVNVPIIIYTSTNSYLNKCNIKDNIKIINTDLFHDRYIIIDDITYTMGTSFNSIGKKRFTITRLKDITIDMLTKNIKKDIL